MLHSKFITQHRTQVPKYSEVKKAPIFRPHDHSPEYLGTYFGETQKESR